MPLRRNLLLLSVQAALMVSLVSGQDIPKQEDYYKVIPVPIPEEIVLEAGGLEFMPDGKLAVSTRRGDIYMVSNALDDESGNETFSLWARGLHEVLGLAYADGWLYATQRPEITRIKDTNQDGRADLFETVSDGWGISGTTTNMPLDPNSIPKETCGSSLPDRILQQQGSLQGVVRAGEQGRENDSDCERNSFTRRDWTECER